MSDLISFLFHDDFEGMGPLSPLTPEENEAKLVLFRVAGFFFPPYTPFELPGIGLLFDRFSPSMGVNFRIPSFFEYG